MTETSGVSVSGWLGAAGDAAGAFMRAMVADGGEARAVAGCVMVVLSKLAGGE